MEERVQLLGVRSVVLNLYEHAEPVRSFPSFCRTPFLPNITESKNGLHVSDDYRRTPETAPLNSRGSIKPRLKISVDNPRVPRVNEIFIQNKILS